MNLVQMFQEVQATLYTGGKMVKCGEFRLALQGAVRRINSEVEKPNQLALVTWDGTGTTLIGSMTDHLIPDEPGIIGGGETLAELDVDGDNNCITVPDSWTKILAVYMNGEKMRCVPYDLLRSEEIETDYTSINRNLYFNVDVTATSFSVVLKIRKDYDLPPLALSATEYEGMPENAYQLLFTGCILSLLQRPSYFNAGLINVYAANYADLSRQLSMLNMSRPSPTLTYLSANIYQ